MVSYWRDASGLMIVNHQGCIRITAFCVEVFTTGGKTLPAVSPSAPPPPSPSPFGLDVHPRVIQQPHARSQGDSSQTPSFPLHSPSVPSSPAEECTARAEL